MCDGAHTPTSIDDAFTAITHVLSVSLRTVTVNHDRGGPNSLHQGESRQTAGKRGRRMQAMNLANPRIPLPPAAYHADSESVRFWVEVDGAAVGAIISRATLHYRFRPDAADEDSLARYQAHAIEIDAAVRRRVASGSSEPVMIREFDLRAQAS